VRPPDELQKRWQRRRRVKNTRDHARQALRRISEHVTDKPDPSKEGHLYRGSYFAWTSGSLDADIEDVLDYFRALDDLCQQVDHPCHALRRRPDDGRE
jgi:hypothetical protein